MKIHINGIPFNYNKDLSSGYYSLNGWFNLRSTNNYQYNFDDKGKIFFNNL